MRHLVLYTPQHHTATVLRHFFQDHPGEPVPEENFWTLWCKGRLTEVDTPTIRLGATPARLTSANLHHPPIFFTGRIPFLLPNQQRQSTEGTCHMLPFSSVLLSCKLHVHFERDVKASRSEQPPGPNFCLCPCFVIWPGLCLDLLAFTSRPEFWSGPRDEAIILTSVSVSRPKCLINYQLLFEKSSVELEATGLSISW